MNPLILNKRRRGETNTSDRSVDRQLLNQKSKHVQSSRGASRSDPEWIRAPGDEVWTLVYKDIPALLRNLEARR